MTNKSKTISNTARRWILVALMCTMMLAAMDTTIVSTAIPQIVGDLGDFDKFTWVFSIYLLSQTVTIPVYGKLADIYGRKPILFMGAGLFLISSAACALAWDMNSLIIFRGIQGLGAGSIMATVNTLAGDLYSVKERGKVQGWFSSVWGMAAILGPTLGGAFAEYASWRWIFLINLPIGVVALFLLAKYLHEKIPNEKHHIDFLGAVMMLLAGTVFIYTLIEGGQAWGWFSIKGIGMIVLSAILLSLTIWIEKKSKEPIMPNWVWRNRILVGCNLAVIGMGIVMIGPNMYLPAFAQSVLGLGAILSGFILAAQSLGWPLASSTSAKLYMTLGFRNTALIGASILIFTIFWFMKIPYSASFWMIIANQFLLGIGFGFLSTPTLVGVQSIVLWNERGVVTGSNMFSRYLGQSLGAAILGGMFNSSVRTSLISAPSEIKTSLPQSVDDIIQSLQSPKTNPATEDFLRHAFYEATHHVYFGMFVVAIGIFLVLLLLPRKFPIVEDEK